VKLICFINGSLGTFNGFQFLDLFTQPQVKGSGLLRTENDARTDVTDHFSFQVFRFHGYFSEGGPVLVDFTGDGMREGRPFKEKMDDEFLLAGDPPLDPIDINGIIKIGIDIFEFDFLRLMGHSHLPSADGKLLAESRR
jgi:hypothetical protein